MLARKNKIVKLEEDIKHNDIQLNNDVINLNNSLEQKHKIKKIQKIRLNKIENLKSQINELNGYIKNSEIELKENKQQFATTFRKYSNTCRINNTKTLTIIWNQRILNAEIKLNERPTKNEVDFERIVLKKIQSLPDDLIRYIYDYLSYDVRIIAIDCKYNIYKTLRCRPFKEIRMALCTALNFNKCDRCISCSCGCKSCPNCIASRAAICVKRKCDKCRLCYACKILRSSDNNLIIWTKSISHIFKLFKSGDLTNSTKQHYSAMKSICINNQM